LADDVDAVCQTAIDLQAIDDPEWRERGVRGGRDERGESDEGDGCNSRLGHGTALPKNVASVTMQESASSPLNMRAKRPIDLLSAEISRIFINTTVD
jgi:hypothetical protein